jgi:hypothetical protein
MVLLIRCPSRLAIVGSRSKDGTSGLWNVSPHSSLLDGFEQLISEPMILVAEDPISLQVHCFSRSPVQQIMFGLDDQLEAQLDPHQSVEIDLAWSAFQADSEDREMRRLRL